MDRLYKENAKLVYCFVLHQCRDPVLAEDITEETFLQAIKSIDRYNGNCKISVWLCQIAKHLLYQNYFKQSKEIPTEEIDWTITDVSDVEQQVIDREELSEVIGKINTLPEKMQKVIYLRVTGDLSFREIGEVMGHTENWARVTFFRAKEILKKTVEGSADIWCAGSAQLT